MTRVVVVGAGGYSGAEVVGFLLGHGDVEIAALYGSGRGGDGPVPFADLAPRFRGATDLPVLPIDAAGLMRHKPDVVFLATPHEASHDLAPDILHGGAVVIDLSAAFRLPRPDLYRRHYGFDHQHAGLLRQAAYGLPEINRAAIRGADLIAVPGCYPTSAILPLHPLVAGSAVAPGWRPIIDSTSGVSGAGRTPALRSLFCEVSLQPYGVLSHRHAPEIAHHAAIDVIFTPHLAPFDRGILSTIHVRLAPDWDAARVSALLRRTYAEEPFVRLLPSGTWPSVAAVRGTNFCDLAWAADEHGHLILVSAIDNLVKGAAGAAVQCMNLRLGLPETTSLLKETPCPLPSP
jgi:N-acetyl-gamma-glutamyl-phosphate reductase